MDLTHAACALFTHPGSKPERRLRSETTARQPRHLCPGSAIPVGHDRTVTRAVVAQEPGRWESGAAIVVDLSRRNSSRFCGLRRKSSQLSVAERFLQFVVQEGEARALGASDSTVPVEERSMSYERSCDERKLQPHAPALAV